MTAIALAVLCAAVRACSPLRRARLAPRPRVQAAASEYAALHDHVTELPNRVLFHDRVHQATKLAAPRRPRRSRC